MKNKPYKHNYKNIYKIPLYEKDQGHRIILQEV